MRLEGIKPNHLFIGAAVLAVIYLILINKLRMAGFLFLAVVLLIIVSVIRSKQKNINGKTDDLAEKLKERDKTIDELKEELDKKNRLLEEKNKLILKFKEKVEDAMGSFKK